MLRDAPPLRVRYMYAPSDDANDSDDAMLVQGRELELSELSPAFGGRVLRVFVPDMTAVHMLSGLAESTASNLIQRDAERAGYDGVAFRTAVDANNRTCSVADVIVPVDGGSWSLPTGDAFWHAYAASAAVYSPAHFEDDEVLGVLLTLPNRERLWTAQFTDTEGVTYENGLALAPLT